MNPVSCIHASVANAYLTLIFVFSPQGMSHNTLKSFTSFQLSCFTKWGAETSILGALPAQEESGMEIMRLFPSKSFLRWCYRLSTSKLPDAFWKMLPQMTSWRIQNELYVSFAFRKIFSENRLQLSLSLSSTLTWSKRSVLIMVIIGFKIH